MIKIWIFTKKVASSWSEDKVASLAAALAYYTLFSITPLLIISIALAGFFLGPEAARGQIVEQISGIVGYQTGQQIQAMIQSANKPITALVAQIVGIIMLVFGASGVFSELQSGLNSIWGVKANPEKGWIDIIKSRFLSFTMVLGVAFLLLVSLILNVFLTAVSDYISVFMDMEIIKITLSYIFSFAMITALFALMFKILPDVEIRWSEVWQGALITSVLFTFGKFLIGIYLKEVDVSSAFGASGSLVVLLIWVYYAAQIFFIGAEISKLISTRRRKIAPIRKAVLKKE